MKYQGVSVYCIVDLITLVHHSEMVSIKTPIKSCKYSLPWKIQLHYLNLSHYSIIKIIQGLIVNTDDIDIVMDTNNTYTKIDRNVKIIHIQLTSDLR